MEKLTRLLSQENLPNALEASRIIVHLRSESLSGELLTAVLPLPYSSVDEAGHELATSLLQQVLFPYL